MTKYLAKITAKIQKVDSKKKISQKKLRWYIDTLKLNKWLPLKANSRNEKADTKKIFYINLVLVKIGKFKRVVNFCFFLFHSTTFCLLSTAR